VIVCVHDYLATQKIFDTQEISAALAGRILIQLSTGSPQNARDSEVWAHDQGADYLDGAIQAAPSQMGRLDTPILLSGAEAVFRQSEPLLNILGGNLTYLGEQIGSAAAMDLATLSYIYGATLGFFHGARICEVEGFRVVIATRKQLR
jgi:3-hydroxyisobutyrate dehydrogenase-like beta-hydroxyacid dehydrogenase